MAERVLDKNGMRWTLCSSRRRIPGGEGSLRHGLFGRLLRNVTHLPSYIHEYKCSQDQSWIPGAIEEYGHSVLQMPV